MRLRQEVEMGLRGRRDQLSQVPGMGNGWLKSTTPQEVKDKNKVGQVAGKGEEERGEKRERENEQEAEGAVRAE